MTFQEAKREVYSDAILYIYRHSINRARKKYDRTIARAERKLQTEILAAVIACSEDLDHVEKVVVKKWAP